MADSAITQMLHHGGLRDTQSKKKGLSIMLLTLLTRRTSMDRWDHLREVRERLATELHLLPMSRATVRHLAKNPESSVAKCTRRLMLRDNILQQRADGRFRLNTFVSMYQI